MEFLYSFFVIYLINLFIVRIKIPYTYGGNCELRALCIVTEFEVVERNKIKNTKVTVHELEQN